MGFAELNGQRLTSCKLHVPNKGAWFALCDFEAAPSVSGRVSLRLGELELSGTIVEAYAGVFAEARSVAVVGGAAGWASSLPPVSYHNDAGVKALLVAQDVARLIGEELGGFEPEAERIGADYVRDGSQLAARVLEDVIGAALWWVDFAGVTQVGQRPTPRELTEVTDYRVLQFDPRARVATLTVSDPSVIAIGSILASPALPESLIVRELGVEADSVGIKVTAWCGGGERTAGRLADLWRALVTRMGENGLTGLYRYRVVTMAGARVTLQSVRRNAGLPDIATISQWPGVAGVHAELTPGAEVLVTFIEGDRTMPIVTHYAGKDGIGFVPVQLVLGGDAGAAPVARLGDTVEVLIPPMTFTGTVSGSPAAGVAFVPGGTVLGTITTGSSKVKVAS